LNYISSLFYPKKLLRYKKIGFLEDSVKRKLKRGAIFPRGGLQKVLKGGGGEGEEVYKQHFRKITIFWSQLAYRSLAISMENTGEL
jgi:hypothetical protein